MTAPLPVKIGKFYNLTVVGTVPLNSSTKATVDFEAPVSLSAAMTVEAVAIHGAGRNLAGMELDTYTPVFTSKTQNIQNNRAVIDLGILTNTGKGDMSENL